MRDFNCVMQVCACLQTASVFRLTKTWQLVKQTDMEEFEICKGIVTTEAGFMKLRQAIMNSEVCVPYLGTKSRDVTM